MGGGLPVPGVEHEDEVAASEVRQGEGGLLGPGHARDEGGGDRA